mmetsp:Transcript_2782/g.4363  ORF Transcript_2782/g.4363 Transcript_2782/m.4363 type:complete len:116 (-) Transcript_2782:180-527(-)
MVDYYIKEHELHLPPTKQTLVKLFDLLNLDVSPVKVIDCLVYCRGKKMDEADPEEFQMNSLYEWFMINLRTLKHLSLDRVDKEWIYETKKNNYFISKEQNRPLWQPHPKAYIRGG